MKISVIKKLTDKYLLPHFPNYYSHQDLMYKRDNDFFIKAYYFESRGNDDLDLAVWWFIQPLFVKNDDIVLTLGDRLSYKKKGLFRCKEFAWWDARKENFETTYQSIFETIKNQGENILSQINTPKDFYKKYYPERKDNIRVYEDAAYSSILFGNEKFQEKNLKGLIKFCNKQMNGEYDEIELQIKADATLLLDAGSTEQRLKILKIWANDTIGHLKLPEIKPFEL